MEFFGKIIDAHGHIFPDRIAQKATKAIADFYSIPVRYVGTVANIKKSGEQIGVRKQMICSTATTPDQVERINTYISVVCRENTEFVGLGTLHPDYEDVEKELDRVRELGLVGIKLHTDFQQFYIDDPRAVLMYRKIAKAALPILFHMGDVERVYSTPSQLQRVMEYVPDLTAIAAHFGGYQRWDEAVACLKGIPNLYFDTSSTLEFISVEAALRMIESFGDDRFFFGTDFPMWDHKEELERFMRIPLTEAQQKKILYENFERLFKV